MTGSGNTLELAARLGYGARGIVYCLVGGLALMAAIGAGGRTDGSSGALASLSDEPYGKALLGAIALGLLGFAVWRFLDSILDADGNGTSKKALVSRAGHFVSGIIHVGLAFTAFSLAMGWATGGGDDESARSWTAWLLARPFGQWLVGLVGLAVMGAAVGFLVKGWSGDVTRRLAYPPRYGWVETLGRVGTIARGVVFLVVGGFLILAAWQADSSEARGLGGALRTLQEQPYGWAILALVAAGLFAFGLFGIVQAVYRHIDAPDMDDAGRAAKRGAQRLGGA